MKSLVLLPTLFLLTMGGAFSSDPFCGDAARCVARVEYDSRLTEFHTRVLATMHIPYRLEKRDSQVAVWWTPRSDAEEQEVDSRVSQYAAAIRECARDEWPTPSTPARAVFSCKSVEP